MRYCTIMPWLVPWLAAVVHSLQPLYAALARCAETSISLGNWLCGFVSLSVCVSSAASLFVVETLSTANIIKQRSPKGSLCCQCRLTGKGVSAPLQDMACL